MIRGQGSLVVATRRGVRVSGLRLPVPAAPEPMSWAHDSACAWTAAWPTRRGRDWLGPREVLVEPRLKGKLEWRTRVGTRHSGHRPDLAVRMSYGLVAIEVELTRKANNRLLAILTMHRDWLYDKTLTGLIYICADEHGADRIAAFADHAGIPDGGIRIELLDDVREQARRGGY